MSELPAFAGSEGYGAYDDVGDWGTPQQARKRPAPRKREPGDFPQVYIHLHCLPVFCGPDFRFLSYWISFVSLYAISWHILFY